MALKKAAAFLLVLALGAGFGCFPARGLASPYDHSPEYQNSVYYSRLLGVPLTGNYADDLVAVALSQNGYHEGDSPRDYGGDAEGSDNFCEYNRNYWNRDVSGYNYAWCTIFVMWCAREAGIPREIMPNTYAHAQNWVDNAPYYGATPIALDRELPRKGDLILVRSGDTVNGHIGIAVEDAREGTVVYISGNSEDQVIVREIPLGEVTACVRPGYGAPGGTAYLDLRGCLDGFYSGDLGGYATADVYIDGVLAAEDVSDFWGAFPPGTEYELRDVRPSGGHYLAGLRTGTLRGTLGPGTTEVRLDLGSYSTGEVLLTGLSAAWGDQGLSLRAELVNWTGETAALRLAAAVYGNGRFLGCAPLPGLSVPSGGATRYEARLPLEQRAEPSGLEVRLFFLEEGRGDPWPRSASCGVTA